jgi:hypothetical protein
MACRGLKLHLDGMYGINYFVMAYLRLNQFGMALKGLFLKIVLYAVALDKSTLTMGH